LSETSSRYGYVIHLTSGAVFPCTTNKLLHKLFSQPRCIETQKFIIVWRNDCILVESARNTRVRPAALKYVCIYDMFKYNLICPVTVFSLLSLIEQGFGEMFVLLFSILMEKLKRKFRIFFSQTRPCNFRKHFAKKGINIRNPKFFTSQNTVK
jgi:hypothetical protein